MNNIIAIKKLSLLFEASSSAKVLTVGATEVSSRAWMWFLRGSWFPWLAAEQTELGARVGAITV